MSRKTKQLEINKTEEIQPKKKAKFEWYTYCEGCEDLVAGECPKHPYVGEPRSKSTTRVGSASALRTKKDELRRKEGPQIVKCGTVTSNCTGEDLTVVELLEKPEMATGEEFLAEQVPQPSHTADPSSFRLVPAAHFETEVSQLSNEEYYKSVVYIPCKKQIRLDEFGNEMLAYDVQKADGTVLQNFYMTSAEDYSTTLEPVTRGGLPPEFRIPEAYPIKRVRRRKSPTDKRPPDGYQIYACNLCGKRFTQGSSLTVHMRIHTGEKPYACKFCPKRFNHHSNMVKHERVHTGVQPYLCPYCGKGFNQSTHLKTHIFSRAHSRGRFKKEAEKGKRRKMTKRKKARLEEEKRLQEEEAEEREKERLEEEEEAEERK